ncbi:hypothetical protein [Amycolatopsis sp. NPDC051061]
MTVVTVAEAFLVDVEVTTLLRPGRPATLDGWRRGAQVLNG